jgi:hypothetical protein
LLSFRRVFGIYYCYYTAYPKDHGSFYLRTSKDLANWSESKIVAFGGSAGSGKGSAECPFVYFNKSSGYYYLFRTQDYGDDRFLVTTLPVVAKPTRNSDCEIGI